MSLLVGCYCCLEKWFSTNRRINETRFSTEQHALPCRAPSISQCCLSVLLMATFPGRHGLPWLWLGTYNHTQPYQPTDPLAGALGILLSSTQLPISTHVLGTLLSWISSLLLNSIELAELQHYFKCLFILIAPTANFLPQVPTWQFYISERQKEKLNIPPTRTLHWIQIFVITDTQGLKSWHFVADGREEWNSCQTNKERMKKVHGGEEHFI